MCGIFLDQLFITEPPGKPYSWLFVFLSVFRNLSLALAIFTKICLGIGLFGFILFGILCASCIWISVSFFRFGKFSAIISPNTFSIPLLLLEYLLYIDWHALYYLTSLLYCFHSFFFFSIWLPICCFNWVISIILSFRSLILSSALFILLSIAFSSTFVLASELKIFSCLFMFLVLFYSNLHFCQ